MITIEYPLLNRTLVDNVMSVEDAVEVLQNVRCHLYEEIYRIENQLEELRG
jgi:hypothetical protein